MKRVFLHIGTEKTASTSVQSFLRMNEALLANQGLFVPRLWGKLNHQVFPFMFSKDFQVDSFFKFNGVDSSSSLNEFQDIHKNASDTYISKSAHESWIVTSEHLQSCLESVDEICQMRNWLQKHFDQMNIILYIREPIKTALSRWSTQIKCGTAASDIPSPSSRRINQICNHRRTIEMWSEVFGKENVNVRIFHRDALIEKNILNDFVSLLPVQGGGLRTPPKENEALSGAAIQILLEILIRFDVKSSASVYRKYKRMVSLVQEQTRGLGPIKASPKKVISYAEFFSDSNKWVSENVNQSIDKMWLDTFSPSKEGAFEHFSSGCIIDNFLVAKVCETYSRIMREDVHEIAVQNALKELDDIKFSDFVK
jgi:hypothetical protein